MGKGLLPGLIRWCGETLTSLSSAVNLGFCSPDENRACPTAFSMTAGVKVLKTLFKVNLTKFSNFCKTWYVELDYITLDAG